MVAALRNFQFTRFHAWVLFLGAVILSGLVAAIMVFAQGLWITNLNDLVPWGLWIGIDLSSIALSAGAFLLSAVVYLVGIKKFEPIARTAVFVGLIGYSMALMTLIMDIGRPDRFWHALAFWNYHSPLWEVSMCIAMYFTVLLLEAMPIIARWEWLAKTFPVLAKKMTHIHHYAPVLAIAGLALSVMHQSSLGAMYGIMKARPIWYRPSMAGMFILSAMIAGPALTLLISMISARLTDRAKVNDKLVEQVSYYIGWGLVAMLYVRFWDTLAMHYTYQPGRTEGLEMLTKGQLAFNFWGLEIFLGILLPLVVLLTGKLRRIPVVRMIALASVVIGLIAFRWDTNMVGQLVVFTNLSQTYVTGFTSYTPNLIEILVGGAVVGYGMLAISLGIRYLRLVDHTDVHGEHEEAHVEQMVLSPAAD